MYDVANRRNSKNNRMLSGFPCLHFIVVPVSLPLCSLAIPSGRPFLSGGYGATGEQVFPACLFQLAFPSDPRRNLPPGRGLVYNPCGILDAFTKERQAAAHRTQERKQTAGKKDAERMMAVEDSDPKETDAEAFASDHAERKEADAEAFAGDHAEREEAEQREGKEERRTDAMEESLEEENSDDSLKHNLYERIRFFSVFGARVWEFLKKPYQVLKRIQYTIYSMYVRISMVKALLESDAFASAFRLALRKMGGVIRSLLPKSGKAELTIGLDNPADTASVLALYGILSPFLPRGVKVFANFEEPILTGDFRLHGRITCFCILRCGLALWMDGNVRRVVRRFQKIINR